MVTVLPSIFGSRLVSVPFRSNPLAKVCAVRLESG
jgi:hypothetical protein